MNDNNKDNSNATISPDDIKRGVAAVLASTGVGLGSVGVLASQAGASIPSECEEIPGIGQNWEVIPGYDGNDPCGITTTTTTTYPTTTTQKPTTTTTTQKPTTTTTTEKPTTTTTTEKPTTTTTTQIPTTTTTTPPVTTTPSTTTPPPTIPVVTVAPQPPTPPLAYTGSQSAPMIGLGGSLLIAGVGLWAISNRKIITAVNHYKKVGGLSGFLRDKLDTFSDYIKARRVANIPALAYARTTSYVPTIEDTPARKSFDKKPSRVTEELNVPTRTDNVILSQETKGETQTDEVTATRPWDDFETASISQLLSGIDVNNTDHAAMLKAILDTPSLSQPSTGLDR